MKLKSENKQYFSDTDIIQKNIHPQDSMICLYNEYAHFYGVFFVVVLWTIVASCFL